VNVGPVQTWNMHDVHAGMVVQGNGNTVPHQQAPAAETVRAEPRMPRPALGIVTALPEEFAATRALLDGATEPRGVRDDRADYVLGTLPSRDPGRPHQAVLTMLGETGNSAAAESCANLIRSFPSVRTVIMSGIACGVPRPGDPDRDVRLGDVVVATWGVVDYDHVQETDAGRVSRRPFPRPSPVLLRRAKLLQAGEVSGERPWERWLALGQRLIPAYARPVGVAGEPPEVPRIHYGHIGSADRSLRNARVRDALAEAHDLRAIEMEGCGIGSAGFANGLEWFVVRGISDYGDECTDGLWRGYASLAAAAYVRALLAECPPWDTGDGIT
jgi:nucleoside phosphorylase